jgi:hypothetical protein
MENKMTPMADPATNDRPGDLPMEDVLCVFKFPDPEDKSKALFLLGSLVFQDKQFMVKGYGRNDYIRAGKFTHFQPVANENGGFYFIKQNKSNG